MSQSLRVDDNYGLVEDKDDPFASKFMSFEVSSYATIHIVITFADDVKNSFSSMDTICAIGTEKPRDALCCCISFPQPLLV